MPVLNVPYYRQNDNSEDLHGPGWRQCNLTSHAMAVEFLTGKLAKNPALKGFAQPEDVYGALLAPFGDTIDHGAHTLCLDHAFGLKSRWRTDLSRSDVESQILKGKPVPIGVAYKASGHIIVAIGFDGHGLIVHDPYGVRAGAEDFYDTQASGASDRYSWRLLDKVFWDGGPQSGWGRIFE